MCAADHGCDTMISMRRGLWLIAVALCGGGCLPASQPIPATVKVRHVTTHVPVPAARVWLSGGRPFMPPREVIGPPVSPWPNPQYSQAVTDANGVSHVQIAGNRPNWLTVATDGGRSGILLLRATNDEIYGATAWTAVDGMPYEVRVNAAKSAAGLNVP